MHTDNEMSLVTVVARLLYRVPLMAQMVYCDYDPAGSSYSYRLADIDRIRLQTLLARDPVDGLDYYFVTGAANRYYLRHKAAVEIARNITGK